MPTKYLDYTGLSHLLDKLDLRYKSSSDPDINTWRGVSVNGTTILATTPLYGLNLVAGNGITISGDSSTGNVTITNSGGGVSLLDVYPVGSIYISYLSTSPATLFGGTWTQIKDRFLVAWNGTTGTFRLIDDTGGEETHQLTINEMPAHNHRDVTGTNDANRIKIGGNSGSDEGILYSTGFNEWISTENTVGGNQAHNNLPPYMAVYMWRRTA